MSTRNTKPSAFRASSKRMISRPKPIEVLLVVEGARPVGFAVFGEQKHQIDVGGEVQFAAAQLAHAEHDERRLGARRAARPAESRLADAAARRRTAARIQRIGQVGNSLQRSRSTPALPAMSRQAMRSISRRRHSRSRNCAASAVAAAACARSYSAPRCTGFAAAGTRPEPADPESTRKRRTRCRRPPAAV